MDADQSPTHHAPAPDDPSIVFPDEENLIERFEPVDDAESPRAEIKIRRRG